MLMLMLMLMQVLGGAAAVGASGVCEGSTRATDQQVLTHTNVCGQDVNTAGHVSLTFAAPFLLHRAWRVVQLVLGSCRSPWRSASVQMVSARGVTDLNLVLHSVSVTAYSTKEVVARHFTQQKRLSHRGSHWRLVTQPHRYQARQNHIA